MQGERSILEPFTENMDLNQESGSNNSTVDRSTAWNNLLNPVESQLSNYVLYPGQENSNFVNPASQNGRTFSGWDPGESSSSANMQSWLNSRDLKIEQGWSPSVNTRVAADGRSADWQFEQPNFFLQENSTNGCHGNYFHRPMSVCNSVSTRNSLNSTVGGGYRSSSNESWQGRGGGTSPNFFRSGRPDVDQFPTFGAASDDVGTSNGNSGYLVQNDDGSGSSSSTWGLSCKRKALEGHPGQSCSSGNWSMDPQDATVGRHTIPAHYNASNSLTISAPSENLHSANDQGHVNPRMVSGMRGVTYDGFPPLRVTEVAESSSRSLFGVNIGHQESIPFDLSATGADIRHSNGHSTHHQSRLISTAESPELRAPFSRPLNLNSIPSQSSLAQVSGSTRSMLPFPWSAPLDSRGGASSGPNSFSGERAAAVRDETRFRSTLSNNPEHSSFVAAAESRHIVQDPTGWGFPPGNTGSSRNVPSSSRDITSTGTGSLPTVWMPHQNPTAHNQQRSEFHPWTLFPPVEPDPGGQRGVFSSVPSAPSSSEDAGMSSGSSGDHSLSYSRSLLMEVSSDNTNGWRALDAGVEGRHRIVSEIRQVLNAMRRVENLRAEDYAMFDPFINGAAELHDRHRDMRLDVDNMSYEELLALEERIGNVNTGLSEGAVLHALRQRKHRFVTNESQKLEPCCICQEDYIVGDDIGTLDCRHEFHVCCIKQWLKLKNMCPICKTTALEPWNLNSDP
ncbi:hypothetical protein ACH5RR_022192 [Cinchona calisaya]|uniref:RING-type E3 ubiquitin transferase n=1 Tax=Cinchona calisaya TaxID=153742 RepID=A0ABD2ZAE0_9GENT